MTWNKFAHLAEQLRLERPGIKDSSIPIRRQELPEEEARRADMLSFLAQVAYYSNDSGEPAEKPAIVNRFMQKELGRRRRPIDTTEDWLPDWAREIADRKGLPEELMQLAFDKMLREPSEKTFQEAEIIINELGRSAEGAALLKRHLTDEFLQKLNRLMKL